MATNTCLAQYPGALMPLLAEVGLPLRRNVQGLSLPPPSTLGPDAISSSLGHFSAQLDSPFPARGPPEQHLQRLGEIRTPPGSVSPSSSSLSSRPPSSTGLWQLASRKRSHESSQVEEPRLPRPLEAPNDVRIRYDPVHHAARDRVVTAPTSGLPTPSLAGSTCRTEPNRIAGQAPPSRDDNRKRYTLFVRQEPVGARASNRGKDRRDVDPPPIIQLLITDFDPSSARDVNDLKYGAYVVHCSLHSAEISSSPPSGTGDSVRLAQNQLTGTLVASPFFILADPEPATAPQHPASGTVGAVSPSQSVLLNAEISKVLPATFFVFDDLSIRTVGHYRLKFTLLRMDETLMVQGSHVPAIAESWSHVFQVFAPKAFPGMTKTSPLAEGLKNGGLKLRPKQGAEVRMPPVDLDKRKTED